MARIYISSTFKDLEECREKVRTTLKRMGHEDIAMEYYVAEDKKPVDKCLEDVASCDLYIGIFAWRYGSVPDGYDKSITELEYRKAAETGKKCLLFLLREDAPWPPMFVDIGNDAEKIRALRYELSKGKMISFFKSADELASLVGAAVHKWETEPRVEPTKTTPEILSHYNPSTLPDYPDKLKKFVTTNRAEELNSALKYLQNHRILLLKGMGGVGKTTIARALINMRPDDVPMPFWFDFGQNKNAKVGDILEKLASYMNCPDIAKFREEKREPEKRDIDKLTDKLQAGNPVWLIFDNLETVLDDVFFYNEDMDLFFTCLRNSTHQAKIIITSRTFPKLKNGDCLIRVIEGEKKDIMGLDTNFAVDYLAKNGLGNLEPDKLKELAKGVDGHPLALQLLVGLVKELGAEDILEDLSIYQTEKEDTIKKARNLFNKLAGDEKKLLERISVYREPVKRQGLKEMFTDTTSPSAIKKLIDKSLLETDHKGKYWLHPLVQEFSYDDLEDKKEVHKLVMDYYLSLFEIPAKKEDVQTLIEAHYHACMAEEYNEAASIILDLSILDSTLHMLLSKWGYSITLIEMYEKMLPKDQYKGYCPLEEKTYGIVLGNLGIIYRNLGKPKKAIQYFENALKILENGRYLREKGFYLGHNGHVYSDLGEPKKAIECYKQAKEIATKVVDKSQEGVWLGYLANTYRHLGELKNAVDFSKNALDISKETEDKSGEERNFVNLGAAYIDMGETRKASKCFKEALDISREIGYKNGEGNCLGQLGNICRHLEKPRKAIEFYEKSIAILKEIGDKRLEGNHLGNLGIAYCDLKNYDKAIECFKEALKILEDVGEKRRRGYHLGNLGVVYCDLANYNEAVKCHNEALKILREIGDLRGEGNNLSGLGNVFHKLGNHKKAIGYYKESLEIQRKIGNKRGIGNNLRDLGLIYLEYFDMEKSEKALEFLKESLKIGTEINDNRIIKPCEENIRLFSESRVEKDKLSSGKICY